jgi:hypothetical protein
MMQQGDGLGTQPLELDAIVTAIDTSCMGTRYLDWDFMVFFIPLHKFMIMV